MAAEEHSAGTGADPRPDEALREENARLRLRIAELEGLRAGCALHRGIEERACAMGRGEAYECPLQEMADNIREVFWVFDWQAQKVLYTSAAYEAVWGRSVQALYDRYEEWGDSVHPDDRAYAEASFVAAVETEGGKPREYRIVRPDGLVRWVSDRAYPVRDEAGQVLHVVGVAEDITTQREAEEALRESEEKFRTVAEQSPNMIFISQGGHVVYVNRTCEERMGYTREELCAADFDLLTLVVPEDRDRVASNFELHMKGEDVPEVEHAIVTKDGTRIEAILATRLIRYEGAPAILGTVSDITRHKRAEETLQRINDELESRVKARTVELEAEIERRQRIESKLREGEVRYRTLVESAGDAIATVRGDGVILFVNGTVASQFGVAPDAMIGRTMHEFFPGPFADRQMERVREVIRSGEGSSESHVAQIRGEPRWFNTTFEPLGVGQASAALIIARDIDDLVRAQKRLEDYREQMTRADRLASLGAMSAMVAHELTQPLTVLRLSVQNALEAVRTEAAGALAAEDLEGTIDEIATMAEIIERFRGFARASSPGHERSVALSEVAGHVVRLTGEAAERVGVSVSVAGLDALPCLSARPKDMEQLFFALIMNAIQAADGGSERRVVVTGEARDHEIELCFADDCGGIAEGDLDQIFKPFFTTKGEAGGTGLGLCVVEHILDRYGAKIEALNRPGEGVTFNVTLPLPAVPSDR